MDNNFLCNTLHGRKQRKLTESYDAEGQEYERNKIIGILEQTFEELIEDRPGRQGPMSIGALKRIQSAIMDLAGVEAGGYYGDHTEEDFYRMRDLRQDVSDFMDAFRTLAGKLSELYPDSEVFKKYAR